MVPYKMSAKHEANLANAIQKGHMVAQLFENLPINYLIMCLHIRYWEN